METLFPAEEAENLSLHRVVRTNNEAGKILYPEGAFTKTLASGRQIQKSINSHLSYTLPSRDIIDF